MTTIKQKTMIDCDTTIRHADPKDFMGMPYLKKEKLPLNMYIFKNVNDNQHKGYYYFIAEDLEEAYELAGNFIMAHNISVEHDHDQMIQFADEVKIKELKKGYFNRNMI